MSDKMSAKAAELNAANQKLTDLLNLLQETEQEYDKAVEHSANYLGYDEDIERIRDENAKSVLNRVVSVKEDIKHQTQLVQELVANY